MTGLDNRINMPKPNIIQYYLLKHNQDKQNNHEKIFH